VDVLADALAAMRAGQPRSVRADLRAPWGLRYPAVTGASFHVVLQGTGWLLSGGAGEAQPLPLSPGDVVFLRNGGEHALADDPRTPLIDFAPRRESPASPVGQVRIDGPGPRAVLLCGAYPLSPARPHPLLSAVPDLVLLPGRLGAHPALQSAIRLLGAELDGTRPGRDGIVPALVDALLLYVLRAWLDDQAATASAGQEQAGWVTALTDPGLARALEAMHVDPAHAWTVEGLAARGGLSRSAFAQRFTATVGEPPLTYLTWWRMTIAGRLLRASDAPLAAVGAQVGYTSEFAFAKAFRREFGIAPGRYRRQAAPVATAWAELPVDAGGAGPVSSRRAQA
jgi:AraC-like DNA-binding protein